MIGIGIVGTGLMGTKHAHSVASLDSARLVSVAAATPADAQKVADHHGVPAVDYAAMLADEHIAALVIATPTDTHAALAAAALDAGKHVLVEKPLTRTVEEARTLVAHAAERGLILAGGHVLRCFPEYAALRDAVVRGDIGRVATATFGRRCPCPDWASDGWHAVGERSGGVLLDMMIHDIDLARWCFGEPIRGQCRTTGPDRHAGLDYALATLAFEDGPICHLHGSWAEPGGFAQMAEVCGAGGMLSYDSRDGVELDVRRHASHDAPGALPDAVDDERDGYAVQLAHFVAAVRQGGIPDGSVLADGAWAVRSLEIALGLVEAARLRTTVSLEPGRAGTALERAHTAGSVA